MHNAIPTMMKKTLVFTICAIVQVIVTFSRGCSMNPRANAPLATRIITSTHSKLCYSRLNTWLLSNSLQIGSNSEFTRTSVQIIWEVW